MVDFEPFVNQYGLIVMADGDAGDAPMKTSFYFIGRYLLAKDALERAKFRSAYDAALASIKLPNGQYIRDPVQWNDPKDLSRDQTWPMIAATGIMGLYGRRDTLIDAMLSRLSRAQNGDLCGPDMWAAFFRLRRTLIAWPLLWLFDLAHVVNSIIQIIKGLNPDNVGDDMNHCLHLLVARMYLPTPVSWLARKIYVDFRPQCFGKYVLQAANDESAKAMFKDFPKGNGGSSVTQAWLWYWRKSSGAPPMAVLWQPLLEQYILR